MAIKDGRTPDIDIVKTMYNSCQDPKVEMVFNLITKAWSLQQDARPCLQEVYMCSFAVIFS